MELNQSPSAPIAKNKRPLLINHQNVPKINQQDQTQAPEGPLQYIREEAIPNSITRVDAPSFSYLNGSTTKKASVIKNEKKNKESE